METINVRIKRSSYDRLKASGLNSKLSLTQLIDLASIAISKGVINLDIINGVKDQIIDKTIEAAFKKEQSVSFVKEPEAAGMSYSKTGWANAHPDPVVKAKTYSMMSGRLT